MQTLRIDIDGMSCAACASRVEKALCSVPGVASAAVNYASGAATVELNGAKVSDLSQALDDAHYPARTTNVALTVDGMSCAACVNRAEQALLAEPGVLSASVNLATGKAWAKMLTGTSSAADLARVLTDIDYPAHTERAQTDPTNRTDTEIRDTRNRALLSALLTAPVFVTEMGGHLIPAFHHLLHGLVGQTNLWAMQFLLTTLVLIWPGRRFFTVGFPALLKGTPEMNSLVALGSGAAWLFSTVVLFAPDVLPEGARAVYFEAAAVIVTLILVGRWLEARAKGRAGAAIQALIGLRPETARVERDGDIREVALEEITRGDHLHIRPGERVAVDGEVVSGQSYVDEAMLTGEAAPVAKGKGDPLIGGTINTSGALVMEARQVGQDTVLARIVDMVEQAQSAKLPVQALADRVVGLFVPAVLVVAALTVLMWLILGPDPALSMALVAGVSVLIIACPCAMGLATPTSIMVGTGRAAELGVFFRQGDALQRLTQAKLVAFDKTGTLTEGKLSLTEVSLAEGQDRDEALALIAAAEAQSEHPIARAVEAAAEGLVRPSVTDFSAHPGYGVSARVDGQILLVGARRLMEREQVNMQPLANSDAQVFAALDGQVIAGLTFADAIKPNSAAVISTLHDMGLEAAMITGDTLTTARAVGETLGTDHIDAEVLPGGKVQALHRLRDAHGAVVFIGDGINDAPALAEADVGIAVGTGTDVSIETADVVLMSGDLSGVLMALRVARATMRNIRQNLFWAFAYNVALIPVAAGVLYPVSGTLLSPMLAAAAMALSSVFVISNALRLRSVRSVPVS